MLEDGVQSLVTKFWPSLPTGMPTSPNLYADDLIDTLKKKAAAGTYKELVMYSMIHIVFCHLLIMFSTRLSFSYSHSSLLESTINII